MDKLNCFSIKEIPEEEAWDDLSKFYQVEKICKQLKNIGYERLLFVLVVVVRRLLEAQLSKKYASKTKKK